MAINVPLAPPVLPRSSSIPPPPPPPPFPPFPPIHGDGNDLRPELKDPLFGLELGSHPDIEGPLRSYLLGIPTPDDNGEWNVDNGFVWLETATVSYCSIYQIFVITNFLCRIPWSASSRQ